MTQTEQQTSPTLPRPAGQIIRIDEGVIAKHLDNKVLRAVEDTLNAMLDAEADRLCKTPRATSARPSGWTRVRVPTRGSCTRRPARSRLKVPKLRKLPFETAIIERYRRREASVEEALVEMYLAGMETCV